MRTDAYERLRRALGAASAVFALVGLVLAFGGAQAFGFWRDAVAQALYGRAFPDALAAYAGLTDGILGGSIVGKWVAIGWLVHEPLRRRERWALKLLLLAHGAWFVIDAAASLLYGARVNVWLIDLVPLVLVGGLALALWPHTVETPRPSNAARPSVRVLTWVCAASIGIGLMAAFAIRSLPFAYYNASTAAAFFDGTMSADALAWQRFAYGLIGAAIAGHFIVLTGALRRAPRERWVLHAVASSMTAWFVVDTAGSLMHGGLFNVLQINVPSYAATMIPAWIAYRGRKPGTV